MALSRFCTGLSIVTITLSTLLPVLPSRAEVKLPFSEIVEGIYEATAEGQRIPILVPASLDDDAELYWSAQVTQSGYEISFNRTPDCRGTYCAWGGIRAEKGGQFIDADRNNVVEWVKLVQGKKARVRTFTGAGISTFVEWKEGGVLYTAYMKGGRTERVVQLANTAIEASLKKMASDFNAEIIDPPSNCRIKPGTTNAIQKVLQQGDVMVDRANPATDSKGKLWYREQYLNCWIHQSQLRFK
jgi:hypothetical protein